MEVGERVVSLNTDVEAKQRYKDNNLDTKAVLRQSVIILSIIVSSY